VDAWEEIIGKCVKIFFDDGLKVVFKIGVVKAVSENMILLENGEGVAMSRYVRHEVID